MKKVLCAVFDKAASAYANPFVSPRRELAIRDFGQACRDTQSMLCQFPDDYDLYVIGEFDDFTGAIVPVHPPLVISHASDFVTKGN